MNQGRVRGRGRGYRSFVRVDTLNLRPMDTQSNILKTNKNILHDKKCCEELKTDFELDERGTAFFQELKRLWNMCKYYYY